MSNLSSLNKKSTRKEVEKSLVRLEFLKAWLGEKKFEKRIKRQQGCSPPICPNRQRKEQQRQSLSGKVLLVNDNGVF